MTRAFAISALLCAFAASCGSRDAASKRQGSCQTDAQCQAGGKRGAICFFSRCVSEHEQLAVHIEVAPSSSSGLPRTPYPPVNLKDVSGVQNFEAMLRCALRANSPTANAPACNWLCWLRKDVPS